MCGPGQQVNRTLNMIMEKCHMCLERYNLHCIALILPYMTVIRRLVSLMGSQLLACNCFLHFLSAMEHHSVHLNFW
jgi:hypothetical protein